jgi:hypothetical protein
MMCIREFEIVPDEGGFIAIPFGMEGATEGDTLEETVGMAADWLQMQALDALLHGYGLPGAGMGNSPREGEAIVAIAVRLDIQDTPAMTAAQTARELGVSTARIAQMCAAGQQASWKVGSTRMVACESVEERLLSTPRPGRPQAEKNELITA